MGVRAALSIPLASQLVLAAQLVACSNENVEKSKHSMSVSRQTGPLAATDHEPQGPIIGAVARRVWIRSQASATSSPIGMATAGATLIRSPQSVGTDGCPKGWYSIAPKGYLCLDERTTLSPQHPTLLARALPANRQEVLPYPYATARRRLPLFEPDPEHPDGVRQHDQLDKGSTFAIVGSWETLDDYDQRQRLALLTHGVFVPTRDIEPIRVERSRGVALDPKRQHFPFGISVVPKLRTYRFNGSKPTVSGAGAPGEIVSLTVKSRTFEDERYWLTTEDTYVAERDVAVIKRRQEFPSFVNTSTHWVDVDLSQGLVVLYAGERPEYVARALSVPKDSIRRGPAWLKTKQLTELGTESESSAKKRGDYDAPWVIEFDSGLTIRGAVGTGSSEATRDLTLHPEDAARLFRFLLPEVPEGWHGVIVDEPSARQSPIMVR
jgi:hypothetical protein